MENTAKNFALQMGSLISLYISISALITLLFGVITVMYPDVIDRYWEYDSATSSIRFGIAMLIVFFPTYIALTRMVNTIRRTESGMYLNLTKWLIYLSLLLGGALILGDLVFVVNAFLEGELTIRFILKALVFLVVVGGAFVYYLFDARGYWKTHEKHSIRYAMGMSGIVLAGLVAGFMNIEAPAQVRDLKIDAQQVNDLSNIQYQIEYYETVNNELPESIDQAFNGVAIPQAPEEREEYSYETTGPKSYKLCALFMYESEPNGHDGAMMMSDKSMVSGYVSWEHGAGLWCYDRIIQEQPVFVR